MSNAVALSIAGLGIENESQNIECPLSYFLLGTRIDKDQIFLQNIFRARKMGICGSSEEETPSGLKIDTPTRLFMNKINGMLQVIHQRANELSIVPTKMHC